MKQTFANSVIVFLFTCGLSTHSYADEKHDHHNHHHSHGNENSAIGKPGISGKVNRTITIEMNDGMRFTPSELAVKKGETVRLLIMNKAQSRHEFSLGLQKELEEHLELMKRFPDMEHDEPNSVTLEPGKEREIIWQFTRAGVVNFACLIPGHYEAGMKGVVKVSKK